MLEPPEVAVVPLLVQRKRFLLLLLDDFLLLLIAFFILRRFVFDGWLQRRYRWIWRRFSSRARGGLRHSLFLAIPTRSSSIVGVTSGRAKRDGLADVGKIFPGGRLDWMRDPESFRASGSTSVFVLLAFLATSTGWWNKVRRATRSLFRRCLRSRRRCLCRRCRCLCRRLCLGRIFSAEHPFASERFFGRH